MLSGWKVLPLKGKITYLPEEGGARTVDMEPAAGGQMLVEEAVQLIVREVGLRGVVNM